MDPAKYVLGFGDPCGREGVCLSLYMFLALACVRPFLRSHCCKVGLLVSKVTELDAAIFICHTNSRKKVNFWFIVIAMKV